MNRLTHQRGNTFVGFILGLVVGLTIALVVAIYVTKVPIPFLNKGLSRNAEQDAAEEKKNKDWDPNAPLYGKTLPKHPRPRPNHQRPAPQHQRLPVKTPWATWPTARPRAKSSSISCKWGHSTPAKTPRDSVPNWLWVVLTPKFQSATKQAKWSIGCAWALSTASPKPSKSSRN